VEHVQGTTLGDLRSEPMKKPDLYDDPVLNFELLPLLGLGRVDEVEDQIGVETERAG
jgi:hypothetical protein